MTPCDHLGAGLDHGSAGVTVLLDEREPGFAAAFAALVEARREEAADVRDVVAAIIADVRRDGDAALLDLTPAASIAWT